MTAAAGGLILVGCLYGVISGFNDGGNLLASFTAGREISPRQAVLLTLAAPLGAWALGAGVARTITLSVIDLPGQGIVGLTLITMVAVSVVLASWRLEIPSSMTLALVGSMVGWALADGGGGIRWGGVARVVVGIPASVVAGGLLALTVYRAVRRLLGGLTHARVLRLAQTQFLTAALQAFAYGANDLGKTVGLIAVALSLGPAHRPIGFDGALPIGAAFLCFVAGTVLGGWSLARRIGFGIFRLQPMQAMSAQLGAGVVVSLLSYFGVPVSSTQAIDGSLVGVGVSVRASAVRWGVVREMLASWLVTLPLSVMVAAGVHALARLAGVP